MIARSQRELVLDGDRAGTARQSVVALARPVLRFGGGQSVACPQALVNIGLCACAEAALAVFGEMGCVELRPGADQRPGALHDALEKTTE
jgi:hypothetical protein